MSFGPQRFLSQTILNPNRRVRLSAEVLESREVPAWFAIQFLSPAAGVHGETVASIVAGGLGVNSGYDPDMDGQAVVYAENEREAIREALTGEVTVNFGGLNLPNQTYQFLNPSTVGLSASEHKAFLIDVGGGTAPAPENSTSATEPGDPPPPATTWRVKLEDLTNYPAQCDWDYNDFYWDVAAQVTSAPPQVTLIAPPDAVVEQVGAADIVIDLATVFYDPTAVGTYSASSSDTAVVAANTEPGAVRLVFSSTQSGTATVTLAAIDQYGTAVSTSFRVIVLPVAGPLVSGPPYVQVNQPYTLTIDPQGESVPYWVVYWGDGQSESVPGGPNPVLATHAFAEPGKKVIQVDRGALGGVAGVALAEVFDPTKEGSWTVTSHRVTEGNAGQKTMTFTVTLKGPAPTAPVTVKYRTIDGTATSQGADADFVGVADEFTLNAGQSQKTIDVTIKGDVGDKQDEEFFLVIEAPAFVNGKPKNDTLYAFDRGFIENDDNLPAAAQDPWTKWTKVPSRSNTVPDFDLGDWRKAVDGNTTTMTTPQGPPWTAGAQTGEGPYLKYTGSPTGEKIKSFKFTVEWKALDQQPMPPMPGGTRRRADEQHFSNSGVYIYDRYEVQIVDPSKYTEKGGVERTDPGRGRQ